MTLIVPYIGNLVKGFGKGIEMLQHEAAAIRHIIQHRAKVSYDPVMEEYTVTLSGLDEDQYEAWQQFTNDVCCHVLERVVVEPHPRALEISERRQEWTLS